MAGPPGSTRAAGTKPGLFDAVVTTHPDHGARIAWTVATPDELRDQGLGQVERNAGVWERAAVDKVIATSSRSP